MSSCIELVKGLDHCEPNVKGMNLRVLLPSSKFQEEVLQATWGTVLSWHDEQNSGLTDEEMLHLKTTAMKIEA